MSESDPPNRPWISQTRLRQNSALRSVLQDERDRLEHYPVNEHSHEPLKAAAPDHYAILCRYFERRLAELDS
jgi:hypothetical protein